MVLDKWPLNGCMCVHVVECYSYKYRIAQYDNVLGSWCIRVTNAFLVLILVLNMVGLGPGLEPVGLGLDRGALSLESKPLAVGLCGIIWSQKSTKSRHIGAIRNNTE